MYRAANNIKNSGTYNTAVSLLIGIAATLLCLVVFSFVMTKLDAPDGIVSAMSSIALCVGSYFAGFVLSKRRRKNGLLTGIFCGIGIFIVTFLLGLLFAQITPSLGIFSKLLMVLVCSAIGGVVGVNSKRKRY